jgi:hypothetical protein
MKKFFLAFSILLSFSFSWAESDRPAGTGADRKEAMSQDGGGVKEAGNKGVCADCAKHAWDGRLNANTNPQPKGSSPTETNPAANGEVTK